MNCELCAKDMTECVGAEPEPEELGTSTQEETEPEPEKSSGLNPAMLLLVLVLVGGGGAFAYFKLVKNKPQTRGNDDLDDYDYGEDDDGIGDEETWETERILTVEDCVSATPWDLDGDGVNELAVRTRWPEKPYIVYDMADGEITETWPDTMPAEVRETLAGLEAP